MAGFKDWVPSESDEQIALFDWARVMTSKIPELRLLFHIPNGGYRNKITAARMAREGVKAGVPDLFLPVSRYGKHGLFIEMKRKKGGRVRDEQFVWGKALIFEGYQFTVCRGADDAIRVICEYLGVDPQDEGAGIKDRAFGIQDSGVRL